MKALLVWPLCWTLYWIGHLASIAVDRLDGDLDEPAPTFSAAFRTYQATMGWSHRLQVWAEGGMESRSYSGILPWQPPESE